MASPSGKHVFISYVGEDTEHVDRLCRLLQRARIPFWRDRQNLAPGDAWKQKIRDAIESDSLVFLACFSTNSRAKQKSYMNEELTLAADEFRLRPPGASWIIPVRFDDGEVPKWELGAGRTLNDLNYSDLFGDSYAENSVELITTINELLGSAGADRETMRVAAAEVVDADRVQMMRRLTKDMIPTRSRRIELNDLVGDETRRVVAAMRDADTFNNETDSRSLQESILLSVSRAQDYASLVAPLCSSMQVAARWGEPSTLAPWGTALKAIGAEGKALGNGSTWLLSLRNLPATLLMLTACLSASGQEEWSNFRYFAVDTKVPSGVQYAPTLVPAMAALPLYVTFDSHDLVPQVLARVTKSTEDPKSALDALEQGAATRHRTPDSLWVRSILRPFFEDQFPDDSAYDAAFDQMEITLGMLCEHEVLSADDPLRHLRAQWLGQALWRNRYVDPVQDLVDTMKSAGTEWPLLQAGLFGGSLDQALTAGKHYQELFLSVRRDRR